MLGRVSHVWWIERRSETEEKCSLGLSLCCFIEWHELPVFHLFLTRLQAAQNVPSLCHWSDFGSITFMLYSKNKNISSTEKCCLYSVNWLHQHVTIQPFLFLYPFFIFFHLSFPHLLPPPLPFAHPSFFFFLISPLFFSATIQTHFDISFLALLPLFGFPAFRLSPEVKRCTSLPKVISMLMSLLVR